MQGAFASLLVIVLQTLVPHGQPMREINCCVMMLVMMLLLFVLLFFAFAVAVAGGFFCLLSYLWGRRVWIRKTLSIGFFSCAGCWPYSGESVLPSVATKLLEHPGHRFRTQSLHAEYQLHLVPKMCYQGIGGWFAPETTVRSFR